MLYSRKSDIENERLPPELINPEDGLPHFSNPSTPYESAGSPAYPFPTPRPYVPATPTRSPNGSGIIPTTPSNGQTSPAGGLRGGVAGRGHLRQSSLGTTTTSPSNRRRTIESTISLIREAAEGGDDDDPELSNLADQLAKTSTAPSTKWHGRGPSV